MVQRFKDWLREAVAEFGAAEDLYRTGHWAWCCFTCQQAAEKALKALCDYFRVPQPGHNLNQLLSVLRTHLQVPETVALGCARLNRYYIPTRYPNAFDRGAPADQFFEPDARQALEDAREVIRFAEGVLESS